MSKIRLLSLFSGIGAFEKALARVGIDYEVVNYCEIDKYASCAYSVIHNIPEELNLGDITKINIKRLSEFDLMTYGFPCQDISIAGKQEGIIKDKTRSGLLYYAMDIAKYHKPKYMIAENVKNLVGKRFRKDFDKWLQYLESIGYKNYWKVLNAKDFGIPQNRKRVFVISIRKDINQEFEFPKGFDNGLRLKDLLEDEVDEKYYINARKVCNLLQNLKDEDFYKTVLTGVYNQKEGFKKRNVACTIDTSVYKGLDNNQNKNAILEVRLYKHGILINRGKLRIKNGFSNCLVANYAKGLDNHGARTGIMLVGLLDIKGNEQIRRVYHESDLCPTLNTMQGGNRQPKVLVIKKDNEYYIILIRKFTPLECWRLMGFDDEDYWKARRALEKRFYKGKDKSNSQMYKMAGNSIVVNVLEEIFKNLFRIKNK